MKHKKILIVDDDKDLLFGLKALLTNKGYNIRIIEDGKEALNMTETFRPDVILMDVHIADVDGREVCWQLKHNAATRHIPVIMISADSVKNEVMNKYNADDFMEKPFSLRTLYSKIQMLTA
jgi:DNA-binding response OmpR family regulator